MLKNSLYFHKKIFSFRYLSSTIKKKKKIAIALSGGIDSSAIAFMLQEQGHDLVGVFMRNWDSTDEKGENVCTLTQDRSDALEVCKRLNIPFHEVDFSQQYWNDVFIPFLESYSSGKETPNPDVFCNRFVKFYHFKRFVIEQLKVDALAMGHYVKINNTSENMIDRVKIPLEFDFDSSEENLKRLGLPPLPKLYKGSDPIKDQTYFLSLTPGHLFYNVLFPLGNIKKVDVKAYLASRFPESNALKKKESMGICFIGKRSLKDFLSNYIDLTPGRFIDVDTNKILGKHDGIETYTLGQKANIGSHNRYYIVKRITKKEYLAPNIPAIPGDILISTNNLHPYLLPSHISVPLSKFNWIGFSIPQDILDSCDDFIKLHVKIRHTVSFECQGKLIPNNETGEDELFIKPVEELKFKSISPGQILTIYNSDTDECYGASVISSDYLCYSL